MNRAEKRRTERRERKEKTRTYNFTERQLNDYVRKTIGENIKTAKEEACEKAVNDVMVLLLTLPLEVLMDFYWKKSYKKRIPEFAQHVLDYYVMWQNGELDIEKLKQDLWEYGGIKLEAEE